MPGRDKEAEAEAWGARVERKRGCPSPLPWMVGRKISSSTAYVEGAVHGEGITVQVRGARGGRPPLGHHGLERRAAKDDGMPFARVHGPVSHLEIQG